MAREELEQEGEPMDDFSVRVKALARDMVHRLDEGLNDGAILKDLSAEVGLLLGLASEVNEFHGACLAALAHRGSAQDVRAKLAQALGEGEGKEEKR